MMKSVLPLLFLFLFTIAYGQTGRIAGKLSSTDTADLHILSIFPEAFPEVSVIFKAEQRSGEPVWNLRKERMQVTENTQPCTVVSLEPISTKTPVNLGIVIDHSESMLEDEAQLFSADGQILYHYDEHDQLILPKGYIAPIDNAKAAVKQFVTEFSFRKDFISVVGFSSVVDKTLPLSQDVGQINAMVESMQAEGMTALYDAMIAGLREVDKNEGLKVLVTLTDGLNNSSKSGWKDVVALARQEEIPVYIIGLGNADRDTLQLIARATNGQFFYARSSNSLREVYAAIGKKVQAFYEMHYQSPNLAAADSTRNIEIRFENDSLVLNTTPGTTTLPQEVLARLRQKEKERTYWQYGGAMTALALGATALLIYVRRRNRIRVQPKIKKVYPNPTTGILNLKLDFGSQPPGGQLQVRNRNGELLQTVEVPDVAVTVDISALLAGIYVLTLVSKDGVSQSVQVSLTR